MESHGIREMGVGQRMSMTEPRTGQPASDRLPLLDSAINLGP